MERGKFLPKTKNLKREQDSNQNKQKKEKKKVNPIMLNRTNNNTVVLYFHVFNTNNKLQDPSKGTTFLLKHQKQSQKQLDIPINLAPLF